MYATIARQHLTIIYSAINYDPAAGGGLVTFYGPDQVADEVSRVLDLLLTGSPDPESLESRYVDLKEEAGRRTGPTVLPSEPHNEQAAKSLSAEAACMANTDGGGALIVGAADDGRLIGTDLDAEWLRLRIYDLTQRMLTVTITEHMIHRARLLVLRCPESVEPIRIHQKIKWRVDTSCVEIDASTWQERRLSRVGYDWSAMPSGYRPEHVRPASMQRARDFLLDSAEQRALDLAAGTDGDLLNRLNVVTADGRLTNAGAIAFIGREQPAIDYIRREAAGGDSLNRIRRGNRGLVEEIFDVEQAVSAANPVRHLPAGFVTGQIRQLPAGAVREAIVNGSVHRDWTNPDPTLVEHIGSTLVVVSPGGFMGGVNTQNIITHPSQPRHRSLAELLATLRMAEREGIGVDRMVRDMVRLGYPAPVIEEIPGPFVRAALVATAFDEGWTRLLTTVKPPRLGRDLNPLLLLRHLVDHWWIDVATAAPLLQRSTVETEAAIEDLATGTGFDTALLNEVQGVPSNAPRVWSAPYLRGLLLQEDARIEGFHRRSLLRRDVALAYARARGRISSTELAGIVGASASNVGGVLKALEQEGLLLPSRENRRGAGFFFLPA